MVRRTKEESLATRRAIIAAARDVFLEFGVSRSTLDQIGKAAGVTRGAIYWHFADKAELFYAMRDEVHVPLIDRTDDALVDDGRGLDPLQLIERFLLVLVAQIFSDEATQKTFQIMTFKCEYVGEFARDLDGTCAMHLELREKLGKRYREAKRAGLLREDIAPMCAASDTLIFVSGLIKIWIVDDGGCLVRRHASRLIADHVAGKRRIPLVGAAVAAPRPARRAVSRV